VYNFEIIHGGFTLRLALYFNRPSDSPVDVADAPNATTRTHLGVATDARYEHWLARGCAMTEARKGAPTSRLTPAIRPFVH
jgi:hypothetical protein